MAWNDIRFFRYQIDERLCNNDEKEPPTYAGKRVAGRCQEIMIRVKY